ncbi:MAG: response regulator [Kofleriaceae bacterium]|nr:response regulator [Kofleriaceae bacterium]
MILLVEDDEDVRDMIALTLQVHGFDVVLAENGAAALTTLEHRRPCLMILDLVMPGIDGREVLARMRTAGYQLPVIVISALDATPPDGIVATLRKPFETASLIRLAARYCACRVAVPASPAS